jgi:predicted alpha/beta superfamily hydrolase
MVTSTLYNYLGLYIGSIIGRRTAGPFPSCKRPQVSFFLSHHISDGHFVVHFTDPADLHYSSYVVDGNALFLTATEVAWRRAASSHFAGGGLIVAIGYPVAGKLYDAKRRSLDLTPPTESPIPGAGGANVFLDFIEKSVRPAVKARFPRITISREALYGHSYGGLFALHALFTRPTSFDCYIASSPSIWWNRRCILHSAQAFLDNDKASDEKSPSLVVSWGSHEQNPPQWNDEPLDHYEGRKQIASELRMAGNALDLVNMMGGCNRLRTVQAKEYEGEEHTSVMACSISRGLTMFFEDWPLSQS